MDISCYVLLFLLMMSRLPAFSQTPPTLILPNEVQGSVQLKLLPLPGLDTEQLGYEYLSVFVEQEAASVDAKAVQGRHRLEGEYLIFTPYFPFERGMTYVVRIQQADTEEPYVYHAFQVGKPQPVEKAAVQSIYPSADELPENLLRFYLYFQTPMKKGQALEHISLIDAAGHVDKRAFMEFKQELWSPDGKRFTLLFDPGRIKRGVSTNRELGPALLEGKRYQLSISADWQDVYGQELSVETRKTFVVGKAYREHINVQAWSLRKPTVNSDEPLSIHFDRVMDHALIQSMIQIVDQDNNLIAGHWKVSDQEHQIQFVPEQTWRKGSYQIVFDSRLEDVAGNNLQNLLDQKETDERHMSDSYRFVDFEL